MSYAATTTLTPDNQSDASFRAWGSGLAAKFGSMGLVQTADTGQINWSTVTRPTSTSTFQGYEIWRFADSLQGTVPIFIKVQYGSGSSSASHPALKIQVGSGSNGTGTLTGQTNTAIQINAFANDAGNAYNCVFSGDTGRVGMALFTNLTSGAFCWFLERTKNTDGTDSSLGVLFSTYNGFDNRRTQFIPASGAVPSSTSDSNIQPPVGATAGAWSSDLAIYPSLHSQGGGYLNAGMSHVGYFNADITRDTTFTMTMYGSSRTFYALGNNNYISTPGRGGFSNVSVAMRYE